jgi:ubiquinone biosynthesis accessory factor UbiK
MTIENLSEQIQALLMPLLKDSGAELAAHIQDIIKTTLQKHGLVTREMFDIQQALLAKTRLKLESLEAQLRKLA